MIVIGTDTHKKTAHVRGSRCAHRRGARRATAPARRRSSWRAARVGASAGLRAGLGDRGLPARLRRVRAVPRGAWGAGRARRTEAHGRRAALGAGAREVRCRSTRSASPGPPCRRESRTLPAPQLDGVALDIRLLVDHREDLVVRVPRRSNDYAGTCTICGPSSRSQPELWIPATGSGRPPAVSHAPSRATRVRVARELARRIRARTTRISELEPELVKLVGSYRAAAARRARLRALTAAKLIGEIAGDPPLRHRRQARTHRAGPPQSQHPPATPTATASIAAGTVSSTARFIASRSTRRLGTPKPLPTSRADRPKAKVAREALRCLKRHLARRVWHLLQSPATPGHHNSLQHPSQRLLLDIGATSVAQRSRPTIGLLAAGFR